MKRRWWDLADRFGEGDGRKRWLGWGAFLAGKLLAPVVEGGHGEFGLGSVLLGGEGALVVVGRPG